MLQDGALIRQVDYAVGASYPTLISSRQYGQSSAANLFVFSSLYDTSTIETGLNIPYQKYEAFVLLGYVYYATTLFSN